MTDWERIEDYIEDIVQENARKNENLSVDILMNGTAIIDLMVGDYNE